MPAAQEYVDLPPKGRRYHLDAVVRLGDVGPHGRVRLDALARHLQDIAGEDGDASGVGGVWVLRRSAVRITGSWPRLGDRLRLTTFCSGSGSRWAERRTIVAHDRGRVDSAAIWVLIDTATGRPLPLPPTFEAAYGEAAGARSVSSRLTVPAPVEGASERPWAVRHADLDVLGHMNNARYWEAVEEVLAAMGGPRVEECVLEFRTAVEPGHEPMLVSAPTDDGVRVWLRSGAEVHAAAEVHVVG